MWRKVPLQPYWMFLSLSQLRVRPRTHQIFVGLCLPNCDLSPAPPPAFGTVLHLLFSGFQRYTWRAGVCSDVVVGGRRMKAVGERACDAHVCSNHNGGKTTCSQRALLFPPLPLLLKLSCRLLVSQRPLTRIPPPLEEEFPITQTISVSQKLLSLPLG